MGWDAIAFRVSSGEPMRSMELGSGWTGFLCDDRVPGWVNSRVGEASTPSGRSGAGDGLSEAGWLRRSALLERIRAKSAAKHSDGAG